MKSHCHRNDTRGNGVLYTSSKRITERNWLRRKDVGLMSVSAAMISSLRKGVIRGTPHFQLRCTEDCRTFPHSPYSWQFTVRMFVRYFHIIFRASSHVLTWGFYGMRHTLGPTIVDEWTVQANSASSNVVYAYV